MRRKIPDELVNKTLAYFDAHKDKECVVTPSIPILYFGDLEAYDQSDFKVLTVGKNPSFIEFQEEKGRPYSFFRFPHWGNSEGALLPALNSYFKEKPYTNWFSSFEPILNGMEASFYDKKDYPCRALHTDICSPLATQPTWSRLEKRTQMELSGEGHKLWKELVEELNPDLMLVSIPRALFESVFGKQGRVLSSFESRANGEKRRTPYLVWHTTYQLKSGKAVKVVYGQAAQTPFGTINKRQKNQIGELCRK